MNQEQSNNFWLLLEVLAKRRTLILTLVVLATAASVVISMMLPKWYKAEALLLPPKNIASSIAGAASLTEAISITSGLNLPVLVTPTDVYARMLKSRKITSRVMDKFDLRNYYRARNFEETYQTLMYYTRIRVTEEGLLAVSVEDKDPKTAAGITNAFIDELDNVNREIIADRIQQTRTFVTSRLNQVMDELDSARAALESFQIENKTVDFDEQTRLAIDQAAQLKIKLAELDLQLNMRKITLGENNAELIELKRERDIVKQQLTQLETTNSDNSFFSLPVASIPTLKGQYETLYSRVKVAEALYQVLLHQREQAKMKEFEKMPTISVLDRAEIPELKSRPQRSIIVLGTFALSLFFSILLAVLLEFFVKLKDKSPEDYDRAMHFLSSYFGWLPGVKKKG